MKQKVIWSKRNVIYRNLYKEDIISTSGGLRKVSKEVMTFEHLTFEDQERQIRKIKAF